MKHPQIVLAAVGVLILGLVFAQPAQALLQTLQSSISVTILVDVSPAPLGYIPQRAQGTYRAEAIHFTGDSTVIAQAQVQKPLLVQAEVSPNPEATLLRTTDSSVGPYTVTAGTTQVESCAFKVIVDSTKAWTLDEGLYKDFSAAFPGKDVGNNTYIDGATPKPTATPYVVYADDGDAWSTLSTGGSGTTTYCVDLTITVPASVPAAPYSTNAVYSIYQ